MTSWRTVTHGSSGTRVRTVRVCPCPRMTRNPGETYTDSSSSDSSDLIDSVQLSNYLSWLVKIMDWSNRMLIAADN